MYFAIDRDTGIIRVINYIKSDPLHLMSYTVSVSLRNHGSINYYQSSYIAVWVVSFISFHLLYVANKHFKIVHCACAWVCVLAHLWPSHTIFIFCSLSCTNIHTFIASYVDYCNSFVLCHPKTLFGGKLSRLDCQPLVSSCSSSTHRLIFWAERCNRRLSEDVPALAFWVHPFFNFLSSEELHSTYL